MIKFKKLAIFISIITASNISIGCSTTKKSQLNEISNINNTVSSDIYKRTEVITSSDEAKQLLVDGNKRFVANKAAIKNISTERRTELSKNGQHPFAIIVSCSDSRVPPELTFDQSIGDIFVARNAGNVIDDITLGSVEYGAEHLAAPLIVVMGHQKCGAVKATVDGGEAAGSIGSIVKKIAPSFDKVKAASPNATKDDLYEKTADENIKNSIAEIKKSSVIKKLEDEKKIKILGSKYNLDSGEVVFQE